MQRFVTYQRVSTDKQGRSGLGLDAQAAAVAAHVAAVAGEVVASFVEVESGKRSDRIELVRALAACRKHKAVLLIAKLDRLSRNVAFIATLMESGVEFVAVDMPHASRLTIHILAAVAEHEREMISARTKAALQAAKRRGAKLGSPAPEIGAAVGLAVIRRKAAGHAANVEPIVKSIMASGARSLREIAAALNARGIRTSRGGLWHAQSVARVTRNAEQAQANLVAPIAEVAMPALHAF